MGHTATSAGACRTSCNHSGTKSQSSHLDLHGFWILLGRMFHGDFELSFFRLSYLAVILRSLDMRWLRFVRFWNHVARRNHYGSLAAVVFVEAGHLLRRLSHIVTFVRTQRLIAAVMRDFHQVPFQVVGVTRFLGSSDYVFQYLIGRIGGQEDLYLLCPVRSVRWKTDDSALRSTSVFPPCWYENGEWTKISAPALAKVKPGIQFPALTIRWRRSSGFTPASDSHLSRALGSEITRMPFPSFNRWRASA